LPALEWTKPKPDLGPKEIAEFCDKQCAVIHEARERLLEKLKTDEGAEWVDPAKAFVSLDVPRSKSDNLYYSPTFKCSPTFKIASGTRDRYFQVILKKISETAIDTKNPIAIVEISK